MSDAVVFIILSIVSYELYLLAYLGKLYGFNRERLQYTIKRSDGQYDPKHTFAVGIPQYDNDNVIPETLYASSSEPFLSVTTDVLQADFDFLSKCTSRTAPKTTIIIQPTCIIMN